eukprot:c6123_g1_i1.p1 GENE.c6123_g1_i1~~c6123_g1_i1.p1  ORF type:complete len:114 (+),score=6.47 c6123_g1_i1:651-992(+)
MGGTLSGGETFGITTLRVTSIGKDIDKEISTDIIVILVLHLALEAHHTAVDVLLHHSMIDGGRPTIAVLPEGGALLAEVGVILLAGMAKSMNLVDPPTFVVVQTGVLDVPQAL